MRYVIKHPTKGYFDCGNIDNEEYHYTDLKDSAMTFSKRDEGLNFMSANPEFLVCTLEVL